MKSYGPFSTEHRNSLSKAWTPERRARQAEKMRTLNRTLPRSETGANNHKIKAIRYIRLDKPVPVYDLTVETHHNFALDAGVFVHNCPAYLYWGPAYILTHMRGNAKYTRPERRPPDIRNPRQHGAICKHGQVLLDVLPFHGQTMAGQLNKHWRQVIQRAENAVKRAERTTEERIGGVPFKTVRLVEDTGRLEIVVERHDWENRLQQLRDLVQIQCDDGNWNYDPYMHGMANGMLLSLSVISGEEPQFMEAPDKWLDDVENETRAACERLVG